MSRSICFLSGIPEIAHTSTPLPLPPTVTALFDIIARSHRPLCQSYTWLGQYYVLIQKLGLLLHTFNLSVCASGSGLLVSNIVIEKTNALHRSQCCVKVKIQSKIWVWTMLGYKIQYILKAENVQDWLMWSYKKQYSSSPIKEFYHQSVLIFDVHYLFTLALTPIFQWSKFSLSARVQDLWRCLLRCWMEALSTRVWQRVFGTVELPHSRDMECFLTALLKKQSWAGLLAYSVSGTNKHVDSPQSTLDKQSEAAANGGRSCYISKTKMKEGQLPRTSLGPYRDGWVLCQARPSGPCCV